MQQALRTTAQATADAQGNATFSFQPVPQGQVWTGNVQVQLAPNYSLFVVSVAEVVWGNWQGSQAFGPVQAEGRLTVVIVATSLIPGHAYTAVLQGVASTPDDTPPAAPSVTSLPTAQVTNLATLAVTFPNALATPSFNVSGVAPAHAALLLTWAQPSTALQNMNVFVQGIDSNLVLIDSYIRGNSTLVVPLRGLDGTVEITTQGEQNAGATYPYSGTLNVAVQQAAPFVIPQTRLAYIGQGRLTPGVSVLAGAANTQVLGAPLDGTYYRLKYMSFLMSAAPAAGAVIQFFRGSDSHPIASWRTDGTISQQMFWSSDLQFGFDTILCQNASTANGTARVSYEEWPDMGGQ